MMVMRRDRQQLELMLQPRLLCCVWDTPPELPHLSKAAVTTTTCAHAWWLLVQPTR
jgi:hypothetical protein